MQNKGLEGTFNTVARQYEKNRPRYPKSLYETIFACRNIDASSLVLEIGIGGGQATLPFLEKGAKVTAVEYGENLAQVCREKFRDFTNCSVLTGRFEEVSLKKDAFDLVYAASAFHWI